jgi:hypothetical protein
LVPSDRIERCEQRRSGGGVLPEARPRAGFIAASKDLWIAHPWASVSTAVLVVDATAAKQAKTPSSTRLCQLSAILSVNSSISKKPPVIRASVI